MNAYDTLMLEAIPVRLPPAPKCTDGPTARWMAEHPDDAVTEPLLRVVNG